MQDYTVLNNVVHTTPVTTVTVTVTTDGFGIAESGC